MDVLELKYVVLTGILWRFFVNTMFVEFIHIDVCSYSLFLFFLLPDILPHDYTAICVSELVNVWVISRFLLLQTKLLWIF